MINLKEIKDLKGKRILLINKKSIFGIEEAEIYDLDISNDLVEIKLEKEEQWTEISEIEKKYDKIDFLGEECKEFSIWKSMINKEYIIKSKTKESYGLFSVETRDKIYHIKILDLSSSCKYAKIEIKDHRTGWFECKVIEDKFEFVPVNTD